MRQALVLAWPVTKCRMLKNHEIPREIRLDATRSYRIIINTVQGQNYTKLGANLLY